MADVIIKGMEMPRGCYSCPIGNHMGLFVVQCPITKSKIDGFTENIRLSDCPLRPAPEWIGLVLSKYDENKEKSWIRDPVAYTLYEVWKIMDRKVSYRPSGGGDWDGI